MGAARWPAPPTPARLPAPAPCKRFCSLLVCMWEQSPEPQTPEKVLAQSIPECDPQLENVKKRLRVVLGQHAMASGRPALAQMRGPHLPSDLCVLTCLSF